ncbi:hypothetical protein LQW54_005611 [Pestalotiopsis sp. IQ-011]
MIGERDIEKPWAKYLILDEAHTIKNIESDVYAAVKQLRSRMALCVMLTATPLEDSWINAYAYLDLLGGHPFKSRTELSCALNVDHPFGNPYQTVPTGEHKSRLAQLLDAVTLRRPMTAMGHVLPPLERREKTFKVAEDVLSRSNEMFRRLIASGSEQPCGLFNDAHDPVYQSSLPEIVRRQIAVLDAEEEGRNNGFGMESLIHVNCEE